MAPLVTFDLKPMQAQGLEYIITDDHSAKVPVRRFVVISQEEARELYLNTPGEKVPVYVVVGAQKGDEGKAKATKIVQESNPRIRWAITPNSTHNAGKGMDTVDDLGNRVRFSLHICPGTIIDKEMKNYVGKHTQINPFILEEEVEDTKRNLKRKELGKDYHLMVDSLANLLVPTNRADDIVNKLNANGSTISGATSSKKYAAGKAAPLVEHVLYDQTRFCKLVHAQIADFNDNLKRDEELTSLGITEIKSFGLALKDESIVKQNRRLQALKAKLKESEVEFFSHENPAQYLLGQYQRIFTSSLFYIGDCNAEIDKQIENGEAGIIECVQSTLLSGGVKFGSDTTAANTDGEGSKGDSGVFSNPKAECVKILVFKFGNTSVGGNDPTMSGIKQDRLSEITYTMPDGKVIDFGKYTTLERFLTIDKISQAYQEVEEAFLSALESGDSINQSTVSIEGIPVKFSLFEARTMLKAYVFGEKGETSGRLRMVRIDDQVESGATYRVEGRSKQFRNAVDRMVGQRLIPIITAYEVVAERYGSYNRGDRIMPGQLLLQEQHTVRACIPVISLLPGFNSLGDDETSVLKPGNRLDPNLCAYLTKVSSGNEVIGIGNGKRIMDVRYIREVKAT